MFVSIAQRLGSVKEIHVSFPTAILGQRPFFACVELLLYCAAAAWRIAAGGWASAAITDHMGSSAPDTTTESELVERAKTDREAFGQLYELYYGRMYNYVYFRTSNVVEAEDLTARTFERALNHIGNYQDQGVPFSAWLYRIAHNLVANWYRDNSRRTFVAIEDVSNWVVTDHGPEFAAQLTEDRERLLEVINRLPGDRQELLMFKFVDRLSNAEIGEIMGRSEGAVKSLYHRTLLAMRDELSGPDAEAPQARRAFFKRPFRRG